MTNKWAFSKHQLWARPCTDMFMYIISIYFLKNYAGMHSCQLDLLGALFLRIPFSVLFQVKAEQRRTSGGLSDAVVDKRRGTQQVLARPCSAVLISCPAQLSVGLAGHARPQAHHAPCDYEVHHEGLPFLAPCHSRIKFSRGWAWGSSQSNLDSLPAHEDKCLGISTRDTTHSEMGNFSKIKTWKGRMDTSWPKIATKQQMSTLHLPRMFWFWPANNSR